MTYPKIELHVHLEATVRPERVLECSHHNGVVLPASTVDEMRKLYAFRDFDHSQCRRDEVPSTSPIAQPVRQ